MSDSCLIAYYFLSFLFAFDVLPYAFFSHVTGLVIVCHGEVKQIPKIAMNTP